MGHLDTPTQFTRERQRPRAEEGTLDIVYEDEWVLALHKPAGQVVHPTYKHTTGTLLNAVLWRLRERADAQPGILTRLDKDTSGLVVIGLTPTVHATMQRAMTAGRVAKTYLAIVEGSPQPASGRIVLPLARSAEDRRIVVVTPGGAHSETRYDSIARAGTLTLVRCELVTGRTHQIRVHLAANGWPVVGDPVYGRADARITRQALHAWRVALPHPASGAPLELTARVPDDMRRFGFDVDAVTSGGGPSRDDVAQSHGDLL
jgi:23S rRNA pseudouridine1911/1915/1917 synthase